MKHLTLELVEEKKSFLNHFTYAKVFGFTFLLLAIPTFFILPFFKDKAGQWFFPYFYFVLSLAFISWIIMNLKYLFKYDYQSIGNLSLYEDEIHIEHINQKEIFKCLENPLILYYNSIRGKTFHFLWRSPARSGISKLVIGKQHFKILISNEKQMLDLKKILLIGIKITIPYQSSCAPRKKIA